MAIVLLLATSAFGATVFTVNSDLDEVDANTADGKCETAAMKCTLRAAVMQANQIGGIGATIALPAGTYFLGPPVNADGDDTGDLNMTSPAVTADPVISIIGAGTATTIIDGSGTDRVLDVAVRRHVVVSGVWLRNGLATLSTGGAIRNLGYLSMSDSIVSDSVASGSGGGIYSEGSLTLTRLTIRYNKSSGFGGGIESLGTISLSQSFLYGNTAASFGGGLSVGGGLTIAAPSSVDSTAIEGNQSNQGGGLYNGVGTTLVLTRSLLAGNTGKDGGGLYNNGSVSMSNSTIDQNAATTNGGGIYNIQGSINAYNVTIAFNEADSDADSVGIGAGIYNPAGATFNLRNSVVAGSYLAGQPDYNDCTGIVGLYGNNKFWNADGCTAAPGSQENISLLGSLDEIGSLADNGGPTRTNALLPPSSLIDGAVLCTDQNGLPLKTDQRGEPRPPAARCDIGAFEYNEIFVAGFEGT